LIALFWGIKINGKNCMPGACFIEPEVRSNLTILVPALAASVGGFLWGQIFFVKKEKFRQANS
jgi:hypothetical protein